jgi:hypothetical protein
MTRRLISVIAAAWMTACAPSEAPHAVIPVPIPAKSSMPTVDPARQERLANNPPGVTFTIATEGGRTRFAEGEPIALDLEFSSTVADTYQLDLGLYDRSGRLWSETFQFDPPESVVDPLGDYFIGQHGGFGGIRPMPVFLTREKTKVRVTLNEWARFKGPGRYRFTMQSTRVFMMKGDEQHRSQAPVDVASANVVELEIVHDDAWAQKELARVKTLLATGGDEETKTARQALRFLTTPEAARAMVDDLCRPTQPEDTWSVEAGLYGSPDRAAVIGLLKDGVARPDCGVSSTLLDLLTRLSMVGGKPNVPMTDARAPFVRMLVAALPHKSPEAGPVSVLAALGAVSDSDNGKTTQSTQAEDLRRQLTPLLGKLPDEALQTLLADDWELVRSPAIGPALLDIAGQARPRGQMFQSLSDLALSRLLEVDYESAHTFILAELARGARTSFSGATLSRLKEKELPTLDRVLAAALGAPETDGITLELHAELFARYASGAYLKGAWVAYRAVPYFRVSLLSYLSRHDRKAGEAEILHLHDIDSIQRLARVFWSPTVEAAAIAKLDGTDSRGAAELLAQRGSPTAEKALWKKLTALRAMKTKDNEADPIQTAILRGAAWMVSVDKLKALAALCKDDRCKDDLKTHIDRWGEGGTHPVFVLWSIPRSGAVTGWLAHYDIRSVSDLQTRIGQLPLGSILVWQTKAADVDPQVMAQVRQWATARKVKISADPSP